MKESPLIYKQSGAVPFYIIDGKILLLLISNTKGDKWIIPKGFIEQNFKPDASAAREVFEEAGIRGKIFKPALGKYKRKKLSGTYITKVFLFLAEEILDSWPEQSFRKRIWVPANDINKYIKTKKLLKILSNIPFFIEKNREVLFSEKYSN